METLNLFQGNAVELGIGILQNFGIQENLASLIVYGGAGVLFFVVAAVFVLILTYLERKILADIQIRLGPMTAGPHGILQPLADVMKLIFKEDIKPKNRDKLLYFISPILVFIPVLLTLVLIPFNEFLSFANVGVGLLLLIAFGSITSLGMVIAGYSSGNKYSLISSMRSAAQMMAYEIPMIIVALSVVVLAGSMNFVDIVNAQQNLWFAVPLFLGLFVFFVAIIAEMSRVPFDTIEAESELVAGFHIEYSGMRFAFFYLAEYLELFIGSALITLLFLGGWNGLFAIPIIPEAVSGLFWFMAKTFALVYVAIWIRGTLPRFRIDQVLNLGWKFLIFAALLNLTIAGIIAYVF